MNLLNVVPVAGLVWAVVLAGERLTVVQVLGGAVVIAGVTLGLHRGKQGRHGRKPFPHGREADPTAA
ncbi:hypothetical protein [Amycolatopsis sp. lyj-346]|uniref:hypothetical protein n=1 Tax=Amycolatopsis sp. lyj-346 TaxID=2789289 RepID=UPI00397E2DFA